MLVPAIIAHCIAQQAGTDAHVDSILHQSSLP
jgi:hypothetical protein